MKPRWLIVAALDLEVGPIRAKVKGLARVVTDKGRAWSGTWGGSPVLLVLTGIGGERVRRVLAPLLRCKSLEGVFSIGYAGALRAGIRVGDLLVPKELRMDPDRSGRRFEPDVKLFGAVSRMAGERGWPLHTDRMITAAAVVPSEAEKRELGSRCEAGAVEMESSVVAEMAGQAGIPFVTLRVVLDEVALSLPDVTRFFRLWRERRWGSILSYGAEEPARVLDLVRVWRHSRYASGRLAAFLSDVLSEMSRSPDGPRSRGRRPGG